MGHKDGRLCVSRVLLFDERVTPGRAHTAGLAVFYECDSLTSAANSAGFDLVELYLRDRYKCVTLRKFFLRLLGKYNQAVNELMELRKRSMQLLLLTSKQKTLVR